MAPLQDLFPVEIVSRSISSTLFWHPYIGAKSSLSANPVQARPPEPRMVDGELPQKRDGRHQWGPCCETGQGDPDSPSKISNGKNAEPSQFGASTISLIRRSTATLHSA